LSAIQLQYRNSNSVWFYIPIARFTPPLSPSLNPPLLGTRVALNVRRPLKLRLRWGDENAKWQIRKRFGGERRIRYPNTRRVRRRRTFVSAANNSVVTVCRPPSCIDYVFPTSNLNGLMAGLIRIVRDTDVVVVARSFFYLFPFYPFLLYKDIRAIRYRFRPVEGRPWTSERERTWVRERESDPVTKRSLYRRAVIISHYCFYCRLSVYRVQPRVRE